MKRLLSVLTVIIMVVSVMNPYAVLANKRFTNTDIKNALVYSR